MLTDGIDQRKQIWLYRLATGDDQLQALGSELISQQQDEAESNQGATQGASRTQVSTAITVNELAVAAKKNLPLISLLGADKYITDDLASRVDQAPEDRFKRADWTKDNRDRFWERGLPYPVD